MVLLLFRVLFCVIPNNKRLGSTAGRQNTVYRRSAVQHDVSAPVGGRQHGVHQGHEDGGHDRRGIPLEEGRQLKVRVRGKRGCTVAQYVEQMVKMLTCPIDV